MIVLAILSVGGACASSGAAGVSKGTPEAAYAALADTTARTGVRLKAIQSLERAVTDGTTSRESARAALKRLAWSWHQGTPSEVRIAAIDTLLADDVAINDTRTMLTLMVPTEQQRHVLEYVCTIATERSWRTMTPALVRSWSREVRGWDDLERPEAVALTALWPELDHNAILFNIFSGVEDTDDKARAAAWTMLSRLDTDGHRTRELVVQSAPQLEATGDPLAIAIGRAWRELHVVPRTSEQLAWAQRLFSPERDAERRMFVAAVGAVSGERAEGLALRHAPVLAWAQAAHADWLVLSREALVEVILEGLKGSRAYGLGGRTTEHVIDALPWLDIFVTAIAIEATRNPAVIGDLFEQADHDHLDRTTEHGGVIEVASDGSWRAVSYPPRPTERFGDRQFVASKDMIKRGDLALFHYHFHVQKIGNRSFAVPSGGDYETARRLGRSSLVFTFVDNEHMNIDLYFPDGQLIDLGTIERADD